MGDIKLDWSQPIFVFITGASRGIGKAIALEIAKRSTNIKFVLLARDSKGLNDTKNEILNTNSGILKENIIVKSNDLSNPDVNFYNQLLDEIVPTLNLDTLNSAYLFHNAGTTGLLQPSVELTDIHQWRANFDVNFISTCLLTSSFLTRVKTKRVVMVNMTSLCGRAPFKDMAMYGVMKAARDQYFRVLALENPLPSLAVLNYSPGPVDTDMYNNVADKAATAEVRQMFMEGKKSILTAGQTVNKLLDILLKDDYESGTTIDYFDAEWEQRNLA